jgi:hypothetical protein
MTVATPHIGDGQWSVAAMLRTEPSTTGTRTPGVERSIGERPSNRRGIPVTGIRRIYPPEASGALGQTPTAAQAAVGVSVCGELSENSIVFESDERVRFVADLSAELVPAIPGSAVQLRDRWRRVAPIPTAMSIYSGTFPTLLLPGPLPACRFSWHAFGRSRRYGSTPTSSIRPDAGWHSFAFPACRSSGVWTSMSSPALSAAIQTTTAITHLPAAPPGHSPRAAWPMRSRPSKLSGVDGTLSPPNS